MDALTPEQNDTKDSTWRQWIMVGLALTALLSIMSTIVAVVALGSASSNNNGSPTAGASLAPASAVAKPAPAAVKMVVKSDSERGKKGPDGAWHDAFLPAHFTVRPGQPVAVTVYNYDNGPHTFTAPDLGVSAVIAGGAAGSPHETTFKFTAPSQAGTYQWWCSDPCDPWAMGKQGYMQGTVTVTG